MFGVFDDSNFPKIYVKLNSIKDNNDFKKFCETWESYDLKEIKYTFIFDTSNVGYIPIKYSYKMSSFISSLKKRKKAYNNVFLSKSIIICNNIYIRGLLELIFYLQSPVANVYIVNNTEKAEQLYTNTNLSSDFYDSSVTFFSST